MSLEDKVKEVFNKVLEIKPEEIKPEEKLDESLGMDSTEMVELVVALKKEFSLELEANEIKKTNTFNEMIDILRAKGAQG